VSRFYIHWRCEQTFFPLFPSVSVLPPSCWFFFFLLSVSTRPSFFPGATVVGSSDRFFGTSLMKTLGPSFFFPKGWASPPECLTSFLFRGQNCCASPPLTAPLSPPQLTSLLGPFRGLHSLPLVECGGPILPLFPLLRPLRPSCSSPAPRPPFSFFPFCLFHISLLPPPLFFSSRRVARISSSAARQGFFLLPQERTPHMCKVKPLELTASSPPFPPCLRRPKKVEVTSGIRKNL